MASKINTTIISRASFNKDWMLVAILTGFGLLLRSIVLGSVPSGFFCDEASTGYDAYSLLLTARDQFGSFLPLFAKSFEDYNEAIYRYLAIPSIAFFGLREFAVRLPAAIIGSLTIPVTYVLAKSFFNRKTAFWAGLLLTVSPWHIQFSRVAFRAIIFPCLFVLALFFLKYAQRKNQPKYLVYSSLSFALCLWTYSPARIFVPLFLIGVILWLFITKTFHLYFRHILLGAFLFIGTILLLSIHWFSPEGMARADTEIHLNIILWVKNYLSYYNPVYLFWRGDLNPRHSPPGVGLLYPIECISVILGFLFCVRSKQKDCLLLLWWLILFPLPAAMTGPEHALRSIIGIPVFAMLSGLGIAHFISSQRVTFYTKKLRYITICLLLTLCFTFYLKQYFFFYRDHCSDAWQHGMKEVVQLTENKENIPVVVIGNYDFPLYIFPLFYTRQLTGPYQRELAHMYNGRPPPDKVIELGKYRFLWLSNLEDYLDSLQQCFVVFHKHCLNEVQQVPGVSEKHSVVNPLGNVSYYIFEYTNPSN